MRHREASDSVHSLIHPFIQQTFTKALQLRLGPCLGDKLPLKERNRGLAKWFHARSTQTWELILVPGTHYGRTELTPNSCCLFFPIPISTCSPSHNNNNNNFKERNTKTTSYYWTSARRSLCKTCLPESLGIRGSLQSCAVSQAMSLPRSLRGWSR